MTSSPTPSDSSTASTEILESEICVKEGDHASADQLDFVTLKLPSPSTTPPKEDIRAKEKSMDENKNSDSASPTCLTMSLFKGNGPSSLSTSPPTEPSLTSSGDGDHADYPRLSCCKSYLLSLNLNRNTKLGLIAWLLGRGILNETEAITMIGVLAPDMTKGSRLRILSVPERDRTLYHWAFFSSKEYMETESSKEKEQDEKCSQRLRCCHNLFCSLPLNMSTKLRLLEDEVQAGLMSGDTRNDMADRLKPTMVEWLRHAFEYGTAGPVSGSDEHESGDNHQVSSKTLTKHHDQPTRKHIDIDIDNDSDSDCDSDSDDDNDISSEAPASMLAALLENLTREVIITPLDETTDQMIQCFLSQVKRFGRDSESATPTTADQMIQHLLNQVGDPKPKPKPKPKSTASWSWPIRVLIFLVGYLLVAVLMRPLAVGGVRGDDVGAGAGAAETPVVTTTMVTATTM